MILATLYFTGLRSYIVGFVSVIENSYTVPYSTATFLNLLA